MVLQAMLQRLYRAVMRGPGLNARPHSSRQRLDLLELRHLQDADPASALDGLLQGGTWSVSAKVPSFAWPTSPMTSWPSEERERFDAWKTQDAVMKKLHRIAGDARDYTNDHGESALAIGFPLLSIPKGSLGSGSSRVLAPVALLPVGLKVRSGTQRGLELTLADEGDDLLVPNPSLLAYLESRTGEPSEVAELEDEAAMPWQEVTSLLDSILSRVPEVAGAAFQEKTPMVSVPKTEDLPEGVVVLPCAVLGLFSTRNLGLLRDTQWMIEREDSLGDPVRSFLDSRVIETPTMRAMEDAATTAPAPDKVADLLVTDADPCQAEAVRHARHAPALVVHGPPGTGKSQTIANIIGDHLARGERVLFVCEKRTALDVVMHRLEALGLGNLCGIIHDPVGDRRSFYMALRERLESLATEPLPRNPEPALKRLQKQIDTVREELSGYYEELHSVSDDGAPSFHEAVGHWLSLRAQVADVHPGESPVLPGGYASAVLEEHRVGVDEILRRAGRLDWSQNPWREHPSALLTEVLGKLASEGESSLQQMVEASSAVDAPLEGDPAWPTQPIPAEFFSAASSALAEIADSFSQTLGMVDDGLLKRYSEATPEMLASWAEQAHRLHADATALPEAPLQEEWLLTTKQEKLGLPIVNARLAALEAWRDARGVKRLFRFLRSSDARQAVAPMGVALTDASADDAVTYYRGVRTRLSLTGALHSVSHEDWLGDDALVKHWRSREFLASAFEVLQPNDPAFMWREGVCQACREGQEAVAQLVPRLQAMADRLESAGAWLGIATDSGLFAVPNLASWVEQACTAKLFQPASKALYDHRSEIDDVARLEEAFNGLPSALGVAVREAAARDWDTERAVPVLECTACDEALRSRLAESESLSSLDGERIDAAFDSMADLSERKQGLVRKLVAYDWRVRQRERLLAGTGSRLNPTGASLRQRLFVRGKRALKLRQMILAGADTPYGDPLFDVCPVWLAGPGTVAQILPREVLFDSVVFDEASQCRLEEALPVLLRGRRVVIAGDPQQLPPTRFFEAAVMESSDTSADSVEELFEQRQAETEDLLSAALNLSVEESFLDVHYRSRHASLIQFSNEAFYHGRLQAMPTHSQHHAAKLPLDLRRIDGVYEERSNLAEAKAAVELVAELLEEKQPASIGIACFNLVQRDLIDDLLDARAAEDRHFANRLASARVLHRDESFEGLFVKNLENVQGDERDVMIISTTFGPDEEGKFRRHFGALNREGGGRRLNVLVTRARERVIVLTSIPRTEYVSIPALPEGKAPNGRYYLYAYLGFAESLKDLWAEKDKEASKDEPAFLRVEETRTPSATAQALGETLLAAHGIGSIVHWGNEGFLLDAALLHPERAGEVTAGVLTDFTRYPRTKDPVAWDLFRSAILQAQGWKLRRTWSPALFRRPDWEIEEIAKAYALALRGDSGL